MLAQMLFKKLRLFCRHVYCDAVARKSYPRHNKPIKDCMAMVLWQYALR